MHRLVTANALAPGRKPGLLVKTCVQSVTIASIAGHPLNSCRKNYSGCNAAYRRCLNG